MSDWQVGDLAVCVDDSPCNCCGAPATYKVGTAYTVVSLEVGRNHRLGTENIYLHLRGVLPRVGHVPGASSARFRKIRPDEHEKCEPEFVTLLKRKKVTA